MTAIILDGKALAQQMEVELADRVQKIKDQSQGKTPILATILVGDDPVLRHLRQDEGQCLPAGRDGIAAHCSAANYDHC